MKMMNVLAGLFLALSTMSASAATVSGVFAPDPVFPGLLLATGDDVLIPAGETRTFTTSPFPVTAEFDIDAGIPGLMGPLSGAESFFLLPGETDSFTTFIDTKDVFYRVFVRVLASDVAALSIEQQLQFFGTQPPTLFAIAGDTGSGTGGDTGTGGTGGGGGTMSPVPLPAAVWLLLAALGGLVAPALRGRPH